MTAASFLNSRLGSVSDPLEPSTSLRLWHGFLTARVMIALSLLFMQGFLWLLAQPMQWEVATLSLLYLIATVLARVLLRNQVPLARVGLHWFATVGVDLLAFGWLQWINPGALNASALMAIPVLMAATLGSRRLTLFTSACATWVVLLQAGINHDVSLESAALFTSAGLMGAAYFALGVMVNYLAQRLRREEHLSMSSRAAVLLHSQVNELVIEHLPDGVLVLDENLRVRTLNPTARALLGLTEFATYDALYLHTQQAWEPLLKLVNESFTHGRGLVAELGLHFPDNDTVQLHVRTQLTQAQQMSAGTVCVVFLHDVREMQARLRTEKLASMGRMSAAVAHEIRNPLAAIVQANALLQEDLTDTASQRLSQMIEQNAQRLSRIVDDVLDVARVQQRNSPRPVWLDEQVRVICQDWLQQPTVPDALSRRLQLHLNAARAEVGFDSDHLRRILVNLLDNAYRFQSGHNDSIQVSTLVTSSGQAQLKVWSDGKPLEQSVQRHLFEPFFSSESRSSGLGLYICRQLCDQHQASIAFQREVMGTSRGTLQGNTFFIRFSSLRTPALAVADVSTPIDHIV